MTTEQRTQTDTRPGSQHTPGPLKVERGRRQISPNVWSELQALYKPTVGGMHLRVAESSDKNDANYLASCYNACDRHGLTDPDRDIGELIGALRRLLDCPELNWDETDEVSASAIKNARALLARLS